MSEESIAMRIPTARQKLKVNFPQDPKGDFSLVFKSKVFKLQKPYLRLDSGYFKRICTSQTHLFKIDEDFNEQFFYNVMFCFYGATIHVKRLDIPNYYPIVKYLQVESLLTFLKKDMIENISHYQLFLVMKIAHRYSEQDLFQTCLNRLKVQSYEQLNYERYHLMETQPSLFKLIIKTHNRYKSQTGIGLSYIDIDQLLKEYCQSQNLMEGKYHEFKFQLIQKTALNSSEYKEIFLDQAIRLNKASGFFDKQQRNQMDPPNLQKTSLMSFTHNNLSQSLISGNQKIGYVSSSNFATLSGNPSNELALEMQITFQKKLNQELQQKNQLLVENLESLKQKTHENKDIHNQMQNELKVLKEELKRKETIEKEHKKKIIYFEDKMNQMRKELDDKGEIIDKLLDQFQQIKNRKPLIESLEEEGAQDLIVQSQFLPAHLIGEMMGPSKPQKQPAQTNKAISKQESTIKQNQSIDEIQLQQMYMPRLSFDIEPVSTPKIHFPKLINFICSEDFNKKKFNLIYRRSSTEKNLGKNADLRERNNLLILIKTTTQQNIGGFISVRIPRKCQDYISDPGAFLFTLTKNQKFGVKKSSESQAIFLSDKSDLYLISFSNDLMISNNCLDEESYCSWPSSYEGNKNIKERGPSWLVGQNQFYIKELDIYEIEEEEMEMVL